MSALATSTTLVDGDPGYDDARRIWNAAIDRRPALIVRAQTAADVAAAVRHARERDVEIAVRAGGHSVAGHSVTDGGVMIDLSRMKRIDVDAAVQTAIVEPGVLLREMDAATQEHGLAVPAGTVSHTGVAGLTLGGGIGWLMRKHGLTIDSLRAVELVTADGDLVRASEDDEPDLFWAVRGAGANFGVVTRFEFDLHRVGPIVMSGPLLFRLERAAEILRGLRYLQSDLFPELGLGCVLMTVPPSHPFPPHLHGVRMLAVLPVWTGTLESAERVVAPLRTLGKPDLDLFGPLPFVALQSMVDTSAPHGLHQRNSADHVAVLGDEMIDVLVDRFNSVTHPMAHVVMTLMDGAATAVDPGATAFPHRDDSWVVWTIGMWRPDEDGEPHAEWVRSMRESLRPHASDGVYVNALGDETPDRVASAYGANWPRLVALKRVWDPDNAFRLNANIDPAAVT